MKQIEVPIIEEDEDLYQNCLQLLTDEKKADSFITKLKISTREITISMLRDKELAIERATGTDILSENDLITLYSKIPSLWKNLPEKEQTILKATRSLVELKKKMTKTKELLTRYANKYKRLEKDIDEQEQELIKLEVD